MRIFLKNHDSPDNTGPAIKCRHPGCNRSTKHGKSYCADHIERMDYARLIAQELERRGAEVRALDAGETLPRNAHLVGEALALLWEHRSMSAPGLTRHIEISHSSAETLLRSLEAHGLVTVGYTSRGFEATCIGEPGELPTPITN